MSVCVTDTYLRQRLLEFLLLGGQVLFLLGQSDLLLLVFLCIFDELIGELFDFLKSSAWFTIPDLSETHIKGNQFLVVLLLKVLDLGQMPSIALLLVAELFLEIFLPSASGHARQHSRSPWR